VLGDEGCVQLLAVGRVPARDHGDGEDRGHPDAGERPEHLVLPEGHLGGDLLDRHHLVGDAREPDDVAGDAAGECDEHALGPLLQGRGPREVEEGGVEGRGGDLQAGRHGPSLGAGPHPVRGTGGHGNGEPAAADSPFPLPC